ncbi:MAG: nitrogen assimilation regulatory protein NtrX [Proteobacteria bacterium]|nr:nitrogen assimilation regulatory protein NtrX [Pseudomonadota bacterium]
MTAPYVLVVDDEPDIRQLVKEILCPVIMMSGHGTVETAVEATRLGAYDFLEKPLSLAKLLLTVERALEADRLARENLGLRRRSQAVIEPVGRSAVMQRLREQVKRLAQHDTWVLISGEPGSGRETFARYLHAQSVRRDRPFVEVAVNTIAPGNAARDLFGSETDGHIHYGASSPPPRASSPPRCRRVVSARTCSTSSTSCRCASHRCASTTRTRRTS